MQFKPVLPTAISALLVAVIASQRHGGLLLVFVLVTFIPWLIYSTIVIVKRPLRRQVQSVKVAIWLGATLLSYGFQTQIENSARKNAGDVVQAIQAHIARTGNCPKNLDEIGWSEAALREKLERYAYQCDNGGKPFFLYGSTFLPFDSEIYDFDTSEWMHRND